MISDDVVLKYLGNSLPLEAEKLLMYGDVITLYDL